MKIQIKRIYDPPAASDGRRILVDRIWPRGVSKEAAALDAWVKAAAPSDDLRRWYRHDPALWPKVRERYFAELDATPEAVDALRRELVDGVNTLLFAAKETRLNNADALREYLER